MYTLDDLTEGNLHIMLSPRDQRLARGYLDRIIGPARSGEELTAQVVGENELYDVVITAEGEGIFGRCTCSRGGACQHVYALLLKWLREPEAFDDKGRAAAAGEHSLAVRPVEPPPTRRPKQLPGWVTSSFAERQNAYSERLSEWLQHFRLQDLRAIARRRGWRLRGTAKADIVRQVAEAMANPEDALKTALGLDEEHRRILAAMVLLGNDARGELAARVAQAWGRQRQNRPFHTYVARLQAVGLAVPAASGAYTDTSGFCPDVVGRGLLPILHTLVDSIAGPEPNAAAGELRPADPFPFVRSVTETALLLERTPTPLRPPMPRPAAESQFPGLRGWDYVAAEVQQALRNRRLHPYSDLVLSVPPPEPSLPDEAIERLAPVAGDAARLEFIYSLLVTASIVQPGSPVTIWPEVKQRYLCRNELEQRAVLARAYFAMSNWSELWALWADGASPLQIKRHAGSAYFTQDRLRADLAGCRRIVLRALACLPEDRWIALDGFFRLLRPAWPRFDEPVHQQPGYYSPNAGWYVARAGSDTRLTPTTEEDWDLVQGNFVRQMLAGPLHWLGLADLCLERGELAAFRLHGLADLFWDRSPAPPAPRGAERAPASSPAPAVTVAGQRITVCPSAISAQAHGLLERIARLANATAGRFDYALDAEVAYRAFEAGVALTDILSDWERLLPVAMPHSIRAPLERWWAAYGRVRIYQDLTVIEFADDYGLAEMKAVTSLGQHIVAEISPRLVIVDQKAADSLVAELEQAGYTPKRTDQV